MRQILVDQLGGKYLVLRQASFPPVFTAMNVKVDEAFAGTVFNNLDAVDAVVQCDAVPRDH